MASSIPDLMGKSSDSIILDASQTLPYTVDSSSHLLIGGRTLDLDQTRTLIVVGNPPHNIAVSSIEPSGAPTGINLLIDSRSYHISDTIPTASDKATASSPATARPSSQPSSQPSSTTSISSSDPSTNVSSMKADSTDTSSASTATAPAANQSSSSTKPKPSETHHSSNGLSKGAAAGIGIGCAIAGALIAACLVFLLMRRKRRSRTSRSYPLQEKPAMGNGAAKAAAPAKGAFAIAETSLPQPLEDAAIGGEMSRLQTLIKNYAQSYYHTTPVTTKSPDLSALGPHLSIPAATLAAMLVNPRTRVAAIRYCIAWTIFSRVGLDGDVNTSLLPPEVVGCTRPMSADGATKASNPTLAPWRSLTHFLLSPSYPTSSPNPLNAASLQSAVSTLDTIFQPYADTNRDSYERMTKLEEIVKRGARFGWTLFGQVSSFDYFWERRTAGEVGIFPALVQTVDEGGEKQGGRGRVLWEGVGTRVEGA